MTLRPGARLGAYEITGKLGEGGMGEVYRATDSRLKREVAIKVLPAGFTADPERLARFEREAQLLAQLHHPNIASIHGIEESAGTLALVMELVDGEDLSTRIARGPLAVEEALAIARQIAEALEAAHERGIVHRDLKPGNVKVKADGTVKVLDFGLAKAMDDAAPAPAGTAADLARSPTMMRSPTLTAVHGTQLGVILGTAAYMAPEQARGGAVDKRADIWAFGVVLFEMLTARPLFAGETVSDTLAGVLKTEVDHGALPATTPRAVRELLRRCLERNPRNRLHDIADARLVLADAIAGRDAEPPSLAVPVRRGRPSLATIALLLAVTLVLGLAVGRFAMRGSGAADAASAVSFERLTFRPGHFVNARFAPDGQTVFLSADWDRNEREIFQVRPKAGELAIGLTGVELLSVSTTGELAVLLPQLRTGNPYLQSGTLAVVSASGGTPRKLADAVFGADWAPDGKTLAALRVADGEFRLEYPLGKQIYASPRQIFWLRVSPQGDAVAFFEPDAAGLLSVVVVDRAGKRQELSHGWSDWWNLAWSPDGREVWFGAARAGAAASLYAVDRRGALRTLLAAPGTLELHDVAADHSVLVALVDGRAHTLGARAAGSAERDLSWLEDSRVADLSADGSEVLLAVSSEREPGGLAVYLRSMDGAAPVRLGSGKPQELSPDGRWVLALRGRTIVAMPTAAGQEKVLDSGLAAPSEARWMPDGTHVLVVAREPNGSCSARIVGFDGTPPRIVAANFDLRALGTGRSRLLSPVSPDGRRVAAAAGSGEVVVFALDGGATRPLPGSGPNDLPIAWTSDGRYLFLLDPGGLPSRIYKAEIASGHRELWREFTLPDRVGVAGIEAVALTPDATAYAYTYRTRTSNLYLVKGLR